MRHFSARALSLVAPTLIFVLFAPSVSLAAPASATPHVTIQSISSQLAQISAELTSGATGTATIILSPGQTTMQASTTSTGGLLQIGLPALEHTNPDPTLPALIMQPVTNLAKISLQYLPCVATAPGVCVAAESSSYPKMTADLANGQSTGYLHYLVTLTNLGTTTAMLQITDSTFFSDLQNQVNLLAAQVTNILGK